MTAVSKAADFCGELDQRHVRYEVLIVRDEALMIALELPGERWEVEFFEDGHIELERFVSQGVFDSPNVLSDLLARLDE